MFGWMGKVLRVDLDKEKITKEPVDEAVAMSYIGGRGFNSLTMFKELKTGIDPLSPENILCFAPGPLTGTPLSLTSRIEVSTLSPLSCILGDGNAGGEFPAILKKAGYDQIVITGRAGSPKYLWIENDKVALLDASQLWGKTTWQTTEMIKQIHGNDVRVACIGQAGENLVRFASVICDKYSSAARGSGAVMGSKNLKAIAVRGTTKIQLAEPDTYRKLAREDAEIFLTDHRMKNEIGEHGSHMGMKWWRPGYRYFDRRFEADEVPEQLRPESWKQYELKRYGCYGCVLHCKNLFKIPEGRRAGEIGAGLEYETIFCLGTNCGILDPIAILEMANLADAYGMCTIPLGNAIAFAKELFHRGIITKADTGGISLSWDDSEAQIELVHAIALREGFGSLIAEGMYNFARIIGQEAIDYCYHVKGLCRGLHPSGIFALSHATSTRGADHLRGRSWGIRKDDPEVLMNQPEARRLFDDMDENPGRYMIEAERAATLADAMGRCKGAVTTWVCSAPLSWKYPLWGGVTGLMRAATGMPFDTARVLEDADRIYTLEMAFNARQGIRREDDRLPQTPDVRDSPEGHEQRKEHDNMLTEYYRSHGCDLDTGIPTGERLRQLDLELAARELESHGPYPNWSGPPLWSQDRYPSGGVRA
jgi:aldehyde:ferredoxin oxidoreductase